MADERWHTVELGIIQAPEDIRYLRVIASEPGYVRLEDGQCYLSDFSPLPGQVVLAHVPWDDIGYISPA